MQQLTPNLECYMSSKSLMITESSYCSEGHEQYSNLLGHSLEE